MPTPTQRARKGGAVTTTKNLQPRAAGRKPATPQRASCSKRPAPIGAVLQDESEEDIPTLPFTRFRMPSGRVLATVADWDIAFRQITEMLGPRGAFCLIKGDGSLFNLETSRSPGMSDNGDVYSEDDDVECAEREALDADEYSVSVASDDGRGFNLAILDARGHRASRLAQRFQARGFQCNFPVFLQEHFAVRDASEVERWGKTWPSWVLVPYQCGRCKLITTVLGAHLLEWPIHVDDGCCLRCSGGDFFNCARCEGLVWKSDDDVNIRAQVGGLIWCARCSILHSGIGTGGSCGPQSARQSG